MAANSQNAENQIESLLSRSDSARFALGQSLRTLRRKADVPSLVKAQLRAHPAIWFCGAALGGIILARLLRRPAAAPAPARTTPSRGLKFLAMQALFSAAKPALQSWLTEQVKKILSARMQKSQTTARNR